MTSIKPNFYCGKLIKRTSSKLALVAMGQLVIHILPKRLMVDAKIQKFCVNYRE